jgi:hypothetical protein
LNVVPKALSAGSFLGSKNRPKKWTFFSTPPTSLQTTPQNPQNGVNTYKILAQKFIRRIQYYVQDDAFSLRDEIASQILAGVSHATM